jgi:hypothetical protein
MASPWSLDGNGAERTEGDGSLWRGECTPRGRGPDCLRPPPRGPEARQEAPRLPRGGRGTVRRVTGRCVAELRHSPRAAVSPARGGIGSRSAVGRADLGRSPVRLPGMRPAARLTPRAARSCAPAGC